MNLTIDNVYNYLTESLHFFCSEPDEDALTIHKNVIGAAIFDSMVLRIDSDVLTLEVSLCDNDSFSDYGEKMKKALYPLNSSLHQEVPGCLMLAGNESIVMVRTMRIDDIRQIAEAITSTSALLSRYANQLEEEIKLVLNDDDFDYPPFRSFRMRHKPSFHSAPGFGFSNPFGNIPDLDDDESYSEEYEPDPPTSHDSEADDLFSAFHPFSEPDFSGTAADPHAEASQQNASFDDGSAKEEIDSDETCDAEAYFDILEYDTRSEFILMGCKNIPKEKTRLIIPNRVTNLNDRALFGCEHITHITLPSSLRAIDDYAFDMLPNLESIEIENNSSFESRDGMLLRKEGGKYVLLRYGAGRKNEEFVIPQYVSSIGRHAFAYNNHLRRVTLSDNVWSVQHFAFGCCANLEKVIFESANNLYIRDFAFSQCKNLVHVSFKSSKLQLHIEERAFELCSRLILIKLPDNVSLDDEVFLGCTDLTLVYLGSRIQHAGYDIFRGCSPDFKLVIRNRETENTIPFEYKAHIVVTGEEEDGGSTDNIY